MFTGEKVSVVQKIFHAIQKLKMLNPPISVRALKRILKFPDFRLRSRLKKGRIPHDSKKREHKQSRRLRGSLPPRVCQTPSRNLQYCPPHQGRRIALAKEWIQSRLLQKRALSPSILTLKSGSYCFAFLWSFSSLRHRLNNAAMKGSAGSALYVGVGRYLIQHRTTWAFSPVLVRSRRDGCRGSLRALMVRWVDCSFTTSSADIMNFI